MACATYTTNYAFLFFESEGPVGHTWSLAVEEHFYLLWPPIVTFLGVKASRRVVLFAVFPLALLSIVAAFVYGPWAAHGRAVMEFILRSSTIRFASLGAGALLAYSEPRIRASRGLAFAVIGVTSLVAWLLSLRGLTATGMIDWVEKVPNANGQWLRASPGLMVIRFPCISVALVTLAIVTGGTRFPFAALLRAAPLRAVGRISYGLYIYHIPIFRSPGVWGIDMLEPSLGRTLLVITLCFAVATLSYWAIERPLLQFARRFRYAPNRDATTRGANRGAGRALRLGCAGIAIAVMGWVLSGGATYLVGTAHDAATRPDRSLATARQRALDAEPEITKEWESTLERVTGQSSPEAAFVGLEVVLFDRAVVVPSLGREPRTGCFYDPAGPCAYIDVAYLGTLRRHVRQRPEIAQVYAVTRVLARHIAERGEDEGEVAGRLARALGLLDTSKGPIELKPVTRSLRPVGGLDRNLRLHLPSGWVIPGDHGGWILKDAVGAFLRGWRGG